MSLPFERALGTAMVYAHLDVKNIVSHFEMGQRIFDAAQLPFVMPTGLTFPLLVAEFKAMMSGNLTVRDTGDPRCKQAAHPRA